MSQPAAQPIDIECLNRYTGGDGPLNGQILRLFDEQCGEILARLEALMADPEQSNLAKQWRETAHSLKGAARGVGALALADTAAEAEKLSPDDRDAALRTLENLKSRAASVHLFVQDLLHKST